MNLYNNVSDADHPLQFDIWSKIAQGVHLWHTIKPKLIINLLVLTKVLVFCTMLLVSYWSKFEPVWMALADSTVAQRQALRTNCTRGVVCHTHTSDFMTTQEAVGTVFGSPEVMDCIWHNQCSLKTSGGDQLAAKVGVWPKLVQIGDQIEPYKSSVFGPSEWVPELLGNR